MQIKITSSVFADGEFIPLRHTCDDINVSPPLEWEFYGDVESFAIICEDPDATKGTWIHWVIFNLPPETRELPERIMGREMLENGALQGQNGWGNIGYSGPCPPKGIHHYFFKIYALDISLDLKAGCTHQDLHQAMEGHIVGEGQIGGIYFRE